MHVLSISLDESIMLSENDARKRQQRYAKYFDSYSIVVKTDTGHETQIRDGALRLLPTNSTTRYCFPIDAYRIGCALAKEREPDCVTTQDPFSTGVVGLALAQQFNASLRVQVHADFISNPKWRWQSVKNPLAEALGRTVLKRADAVRVGTEHERNKVRSVVKDSTTVSVAPVRMDFDGVVDGGERSVTELRSAFGFDDRPVIFFAGRFTGQKNLNKWLEVATKVHEAVNRAPIFVMVGDGPQSENIQQQVTDLGIEDSFRFPGWVETDRLAEYYGLADVFLITSDYEGTSRVVVEAGMNETPVVATPFAGAIDNIVDGETGFVADDVETLAQRVCELIEDATVRQQMGTRAREHLMGRFDAERLTEEYVEFLQDGICGE
ncbi:glycosyltransferase family 4 protein [Haloarcula sp. H-GB5]